MRAMIEANRDQLRKDKAALTEQLQAQCEVNAIQAEEMCRQCERADALHKAKAENDERSKLSEFTDGRIHTCHAECQRIECVQGREIAALKLELDQLRGVETQRISNVDRENVRLADVYEVSAKEMERLRKYIGDCEYEHPAKERDTLRARVERLEAALGRIANHDGHRHSMDPDEIAREALE
jgi:hypothetical protein